MVKKLVIIASLFVVVVFGVGIYSGSGGKSVWSYGRAKARIGWWVDNLNGFFDSKRVFVVRNRDSEVSGVQLDQDKLESLFIPLGLFSENGMAFPGGDPFKVKGMILAFLEQDAFVVSPGVRDWDLDLSQSSVHDETDSPIRLMVMYFEHRSNRLRFDFLLDHEGIAERNMSDQELSAYVLSSMVNFVKTMTMQGENGDQKVPYEQVLNQTYQSLLIKFSAGDNPGLLIQLK